MNLHLIGSFQQVDAYFLCDSPAEETWQHIGRFATKEFISRLVPDVPATWDAISAYSRVRVAQAMEFRAAAKDRSLLTSPLPYYYAFLSAMRALTAIKYEVFPRPAHGLAFIEAETLSESKASLRAGTFTEYLTLNGNVWQTNQAISLKEALGCIVETHLDIASMSNALSYVQVVRVLATTQNLRLRFPGYPGDFSTQWEQDFPSLAKVCSIVEDCTLEVRSAYAGKGDALISGFLSMRLLPSLRSGMDPTWYTYRALDPALKLPRSTYYFVAMFILGSAVRYKPELVVEVSSSDSELGWLLRRFLSDADRFFPQLLLWDHYAPLKVYFGNS